MFLFGVFLWGPVADRAAALAAEGMSDFQALALAAAELTREQTDRIAVPRRFSIPMREMLQLQTRFEKTHGARALAFLESKRFRAAYDLLVLRALVGNADAKLAHWWTTHSGAAAGAAAPGARSRQRRKRQPPASSRRARRRPGAGRPRPGSVPPDVIAAAHRRSRQATSTV